jgi:hypothetical protein
MKPWLTYLIVNVVSLLTLLAVGYAVAILINYKGKSKINILAIVKRWFDYAYFLKTDTKYYGDYCVINNDCSQTTGLVCSNNKCVCPTTGLFNGYTCG